MGFSKTIVQRLPDYVTDHQTDWDQYPQPLVYFYSIQLHRRTGMKPFDLALTQHLPSISQPRILDRPGIPISYERLIPVQYKWAAMWEVNYALERDGYKQSSLRRKYEKDFNNKAQLCIEMQPGDQVYVDRPP